MFAVFDERERRVDASIWFLSAGMPRFSSQPAAASVQQGSSHVLPCEVNADLVPFARWEKERQPVELSSRLLQLPSGALLISNASEGDAGLYRCLLENVGSSKSSDEAQLQIVPGKRKDMRNREMFLTGRFVANRSFSGCNHGAGVEA